MAIRAKRYSVRNTSTYIRNILVKRTFINNLEVFHYVVLGFIP